jgi:hypothetical protein
MEDGGVRHRGWCFLDNLAAPVAHEPQCASKKKKGGGRTCGVPFGGGAALSNRARKRRCCCHTHHSAPGERKGKHRVR